MDWKDPMGALGGGGGGSRSFRLFMVRLLAFHSIIVAKCLHTPFNTVISPPKYTDAICSSSEAW